MFVPVLLILLLIICALVWGYLPRRENEYLKNIPGPKPIPFFGNIFEATSTQDLLDVLFKFSKEFNGLYRLFVGPLRTALIVSDYKFLEAILSSTTVLQKSEEYYYLKPWLGLGLLTSDGSKWKKHRKILTPAFHFKILEQFIGVYEDAGNNLVKKLQCKDGEASVDIFPFVALCTLDIICESAMGTSINAQTNHNSDYVGSVKAMCKIVYDRIFHILEMSDITYPLTKNYYVQEKSLAILHQKTNEVIVKRRQELQQNNNASEVRIDDFAYGKRRKAFLDLLLEARIDGRPLTNEEIREEVDTFMFEGHDTTASAISFALHSLANNPEVQKKVYEEQLTLFGNNKTPAVTYADLQDMKYLELVIKETLRLYPSVPIYGRKTTDRVEFDNYVIPKDITIAIFAFAIHRDPKHYKDPEKFDPTRFEDIDGTRPYAYVPFSAGPRNCIGQKFAMLEMKSTISKIIRNFELHPASPTGELHLVAETVLKSSTGVNISLRGRE